MLTVQRFGSTVWFPTYLLILRIFLCALSSLSQVKSRSRPIITRPHPEPLRLLAWIEPTDDDSFDAVIVAARFDFGTSPPPTAKRFPTFADARDRIQAKAIVPGSEIRWMS